MHADECLPRRRGLALWRWWEAMALQDVADRLVTDGVAQIGQGSHDAVIAPRAILLRHAHHQGLQLCRDLRASKRLALLGTIELLGHQLAVPREDRVGCDDAGDLRQRLLAQLLSNLGQGLALAITQAYTTVDLVAQDAIFGHQVLVAQQEFLIHRTRDIRKQLLPIHPSSPFDSSACTDGDYGSLRSRKQAEAWVMDGV